MFEDGTTPAQIQKGLNQMILQQQQQQQQHQQQQRQQQQQQQQLQLQQQQQPNQKKHNKNNKNKNNHNKKKKNVLKESTISPCRPVANPNRIVAPPTARILISSITLRATISSLAKTSFYTGNYGTYLESSQTAMKRNWMGETIMSQDLEKSK